MDTQAEPTQLAQPSPHNAVAPVTTKRTNHAANQEPGRRGVTNQEPRISVDPMRATDRYRLVMPFDAGL
ncbi:MAG: hypothetical protein JNL12_09930 [Planctomycetes bacterium]|nr:hypothetical protein [Planctomycetota bacterium]